MGFSIHIPLRQNVLKIKSADRLRYSERGGRAKVVRLGDVVLVWAKASVAPKPGMDCVLKPTFD